jgi:DNA-binding GntR family transcriptional regulator
MTERRGKSNYSTLKRPAHQSLADIAYKVLLEAIINQEFEPGAHISIDSFAKQLKMSNTPVREALMRANGERLVTQKTNHGFVVTEILAPEELRHLFDVRHLLEVHAIQTAVITKGAISEIEGLVEQMIQAKDGAIYADYKDYLLLDQQFHRALIELSGNNFIIKAWDDLKVHLHLSRLYTGIGLFDRDDSVNEHQAILDAVCAGDLALIAALLSQHISRVGKRMEHFLGG